MEAYPQELLGWSSKLHRPAAHTALFLWEFVYLLFRPMWNSEHDNTAYDCVSQFSYVLCEQLAPFI